MSNLGFNGRKFLTEEEWQTYKRRKPVRYIRKGLMNVCEICGLPVKENDPFQNAHRIGFDLGIIHLALTPEFLDGNANIVTAHRTSCNKKAELNIEQAMALLLASGETEIPAFLPEKTQEIWHKIVQIKNAKRSDQPNV